MERCADITQLIVRSSYMKKTTDKDVSQKMEHYERNISITSQLMFTKFQHYFDRAGYTKEDITNLGRLYAFYFFNIYSDNLGKTTPNYERNGVITFVKQRMSYLAGLCDRMATNFHVNKTVSGFYAKTELTKNIHNYENIPNPTEIGFRKITGKELKQIKQNCRGGMWKDSDGYDVIKLCNFEELTDTDYIHIMHEGLDRNLSTEDKQIHEQQLAKEEAVEAEINEFVSKPLEAQATILEKIIKYSMDRQRAKDAKKLLKILLSK